MRFLLFAVVMSFAVSSCQNTSKQKMKTNPNVAELDSVKRVVSEALSVLENFPKEVIMRQMVVVEEYETFFSTTDYRYTREQYLGEIDKIGLSYRAFSKVFQALPSLRDEANLSYEQLESLRKAYEQGQVDNETFTQYLQQEKEAADVLMFNFRKRVSRALEFSQALDTLLPRADVLKQEALQNIDY